MNPCRRGNVHPPTRANVAVRRAVRSCLHRSRMTHHAGVVAVGLLAAIPLDTVAGVFPALLPVTELDGRNGFRVEGIRNDFAGRAVSGVGDVNGDAIGDLLIGASYATPADGRSRAGESFVVFGHAGSFPAELEIRDLLPDRGGDGSAGFILMGIDAGDRSGFSVSDAGDVNGDGIGDLFVGAYRADSGGHTDTGESYVVFGRATGFPATLELRSLLPENGGDGRAGFVMQGVHGRDLLGSGVSGVGDVNGDGTVDLLVGAVNGSYVVFGNAGLGAGGSVDLTSLDGSNGFAFVGLVGVRPRDAARAGDVNGDGIADLIVGKPPMVIFGSTTLGSSGELDPADLDGSNGFVIIAPYASAFSGLGDVNGDGYDDVIVGNEDATVGDMKFAGQGYVVFGGADAGCGGSIDVADLDGRSGFTIDGFEFGQSTGFSVTGPGDLNGDGIADIGIHGGSEDDDNYYGEGAAYVVYGDPTIGRSGHIDLADIDGTTGFLTRGRNYDALAYSMSGRVDINGDGHSDLILGSPGGLSGEGGASVVFGRFDTDDDGIEDLEDNCTGVANRSQRDTDDDGFGNACDGDLDNDCLIDPDDVAIMKSRFFTDDEDADLNGDGNVNFIDLGIVKMSYFQPPGPSGVPNRCD